MISRLCEPNRYMYCMHDANFWHYRWTLRYHYRNQVFFFSFLSVFQINKDLSVWVNNIQCVHGIFFLQIQLYPVDGYIKCLFFIVHKLANFYTSVCWVNTEQYFDWCEKMRMLGTRSENVENFIRLYFCGQFLFFFLSVSLL